ncbi:MAG: hypothetical protein JWR81_3044 [Pseudonocardia sp.]|jgi:hypothetical protein|nr:hypothetical protein [Pseudonocardia sp.]MDT7617437.1 hypothetical protein [Pseudonocardiales bacterium]
MATATKSTDTTAADAEAGAAEQSEAQLRAKALIETPLPYGLRVAMILLRVWGSGLYRARSCRSLVRLRSVVG